MKIIIMGCSGNLQRKLRMIYGQYIFIQLLFKRITYALTEQYIIDDF